MSNPLASETPGEHMAIDAGTDKVLIEGTGPIAVVTLNRPEVRNAVDVDVAHGLERAFAAIDADPSIVVAILTGAGGTFSAGADLKGFLRDEKPVTDEGGFGGITRRPPATPLIAAIEGFAVGGGLELALSCDLIIAAENAKLGLPEVKVGLPAAGGGLLRLAKRIPYHVAMEMVLTGDPISADRAYELGLVNDVTPPQGALDAARALADRIAQGGPLALRGSKQVLQAQWDWGEDEAWEAQERYLVPIFESEDAKEGPRAFAEKRVPTWTGR